MALVDGGAGQATTKPEGLKIAELLRDREGIKFLGQLEFASIPTSIRLQFHSIVV